MNICNWKMNMDTLIPGIVLQWPCISNRRWMRLWGPTWWIAVCFTALLSPSSIWACKKMAWDSPWGYRPCGCSATWIQLVTVACANNKQHACIYISIYIYTHGAKNPFTCARTHTCTHIHMYIGRSMYQHMHVHTSIHMRTHTCTEADLCMNICMCTQAYICTHTCI